MRTFKKQKLIGTLVLAAALSFGVFGTAKAAQGFFLGTNQNLIFDAVVGQVNGNTVTVYTTSSNPITLTTNRRTLISGGGNVSNLAPGDNVKVIARRTGGGLVASIINRSGNNVSGYGTAGDSVLVNQGRVVAKGADTFTVRLNGSADVTFHVTSATRFFGSSFVSLQVGQRVEVFGNDTGSSSTGFVARYVFR